MRDRAYRGWSAANLDVAHLQSELTDMTARAEAAESALKAALAEIRR